MGKMERDGDAGLVKTEKKSKKSKKNKTNDLLDVDDGGFPQEKGHKHKEKKRKSESDEDGDETQNGKGNLEDGDLRKDKKRKRDSSESDDTSEKVQIKLVEQNGPAAEQDCDPKPRKEKKRKHKHHSQEREYENDKIVHDSKSSLDKDISSMKKNVSGANEKNTEGGRKKRDGKGIEISSEEFEGDMVETTDEKKKKKKTDGQNTDAEMHASGKERSTPQDGHLVDGESKIWLALKTQDSEDNQGNTSEILQMGKIRKDEDAGPVRTEKKLKKSENKTKDPVDVGDGFRKEKGQKHREKKRSSESNEDKDEAPHGKGTMEDGGALQKDKKKRNRDYSETNHPSEKVQIKENEQGRDDGSAVERDCGPKPRKEKKRKHKHHGQEKELEGDMVEKIDKNKKKTDGQSSIEDSQGKKKKTKSVENNVEKPKAKRKSKKVSFSGNVEIFPSSGTHISKEDGLVRGKRFTPEEDAIVKEAVFNYIEAHGLGEDGLQIVLNCRSHTGRKRCWQEIATCIPYRPSTAVYYRAHVLFERAEKRQWTPEEKEFLKKFYKKHGNKWKKAAKQLGKHRFHVKDAWRRIKFDNGKRRRWTQEEYQNLYDLVNLDLRMKLSCDERKLKHGMLRDNIPWTAISEKLSRSDANCCIKWYHQLTSSLVVENKWSDVDDYRLIGVLYELGAACEEDMDWDSLLEHRSGDICRKRWNQMVKHIDRYWIKPFAELVDTLAKRYVPDLAEVREAWDNKPLVM